MNKINFFIVIAILTMAGLGAYYFISNPAQTEKNKIEPIHKISVKTTSVELGNYPVVIKVMGQVIPAHTATLKAQISGEIISVSDEFIPGGMFKKGESIVKINPSDYEIDISVKKALVQQANAALRLELGQQQIAKDELKIIEKSTGRALKNNDLALRKPQLEQARASLNSAKARLRLAEINLKRTNITAPFNGMINQRNADLGDVLNSFNNTIATLVATNEYWVEIEIPIHDMRWVEVGSKTIITLNNNLGIREGSILKSTGLVNKNSRLASMIISVSDPLLLEDKTIGKSPLILGDFVHVDLIGYNLENTARIPISYIHDNDKIWIEKDGALIIKPIIIAYSDREFAYVTKGINNTDNIITSNIMSPINGMEINVLDNAGTNR